MYVLDYLSGKDRLSIHLEKLAPLYRYSYLMLHLHLMLSRYNHILIYVVVVIPDH